MSRALVYIVTLTVVAHGIGAPVCLEVEAALASSVHTVTKPASLVAHERKISDMLHAAANHRYGDPDLWKDIEWELAKYRIQLEKWLDEGNPFTLFPMDKDFKNEDERGVHYIRDPKDREKFRLVVRDGKLWDARGKLFDTRDAKPNAKGKPRAIVVMDSHGNLFGSKESEMNRFHHSSFFAGAPVAFSGEMECRDGVLESTGNVSSHHPSNFVAVIQLLISLKRQGLTRLPDELLFYEHRVEIESNAPLSIPLGLP